MAVEPLSHTHTIQHLLFERKDDLTSDELGVLVERLAFIPERVAHSKLKKKCFVQVGGERVMIWIEVPPFGRWEQHPCVVVIKDNKYHIIRPITGELLPIEQQEDD